MENSDTVTNSDAWEIDPITITTEPTPVSTYPLDENDLPIHEAAYKGDVAILESLITSAKDIDVRSAHQCTPLHLAIRGNHAEAVHILLSAGADPNLEDDVEPAYMLSFKALGLAAYLGSDLAIVPLLDHGLEIPAQCFTRAASVNKVSCMRKMMQKIGFNDFSDCTRLAGVRDALQLAALCWHLEAVEYLLQEIDEFPDESVEEDRSALGCALSSAVQCYDCDERCRPSVVCGRPERLFKILNLLVAAGADVNEEHPTTKATAFWNSFHTQTVPRDIIWFLFNNGLSVNVGSSKLFGLVRDTDDDPSLIEAFIAAGVDPTATDVGMSTPLHCVGRRSFAEILIAHGACISARDHEGSTPLHRACYEGHVDVVEFLISRGANVNEVATVTGWTSLMFAVSDPDEFQHREKDDLRLARILISHGADAHVVAAGGLTILHSAARYGTVEVVRYLLEQGVDGCAATKEGETVMHWACFNGNKRPHAREMVKLLLDHGADLEAKDASGATALFSALRRTQYAWPIDLSIVNALIENGANKGATDYEGKTALEQVNYDQLTFDENGFLCMKPPASPTFPRSSMRGRGRGAGRSRGRGSIR